MAQKRQIKARDVIVDIRSGKTDAELMETYDLSSKGLQSLFHKLVASKAIRHAELYSRSPAYKDTVDLTSARLTPREDVSVPVYIVETATGQQGLVRDISENGLRVVGINAVEGEIKGFRLSVDLFTHAQNLEFQATCRWVQLRGQEKKFIVAGYAITQISDDDLADLRRFIQIFSLDETATWE